MKQKKKTYMLAMKNDDPELEIEFEMKFQFSLSDRQRYEIMDQLVKDGLEFVEKNGFENTPAIIARS